MASTRDQYVLHASTTGTASLDRFKKKVEEINSETRSVKSQLTGVISGFTGFVGVADAAALAGLGLRNAIAGVAGEFRRIIFDSARAADEIAKTARGLGVGVEEFQKLQYAMSIFGVTTTQLTRSLTAFSIAVSAVRDGTASYQRVFDRLGVSIYDKSGEIRGLVDIFDDVATSIQKGESSIARLSDATTVFGRRGGIKLVVGALSFDQLQTYADLAERLGSVFTELETQQAEFFNDSVQHLQFAAKSFERALFADYVEPLTAIAIGTREWIIEMRELSEMEFSSVGDSLKENLVSPLEHTLLFLAGILDFMRAMKASATFVGDIVYDVGTLGALGVGAATAKLSGNDREAGYLVDKAKTVGGKMLGEASEPMQEIVDVPFFWRDRAQSLSDHIYGVDASIELQKEAARVKLTMPEIIAGVIEDARTGVRGVAKSESVLAAYMGQTKGADAKSLVGRYHPITGFQDGFDYMRGLLPNDLARDPKGLTNELFAALTVRNAAYPGASGFAGTEGYADILLNSPAPRLLDSNVPLPHRDSNGVLWTEQTNQAYLDARKSTGYTGAVADLPEYLDPIGVELWNSRKVKKFVDDARDQFGVEIDPGESNESVVDAFANYFAAGNIPPRAPNFDLTTIFPNLDQDLQSRLGQFADLGEGTEIRRALAQARRQSDRLTPEEQIEEALGLNDFVSRARGLTRQRDRFIRGGHSRIDSAARDIDPIASGAQPADPSVVAVQKSALEAEANEFYAEQLESLREQFAAEWERILSARADFGDQFARGWGESFDDLRDELSDFAADGRRLFDTFVGGGREALRGLIAGKPHGEVFQQYRERIAGAAVEQTALGVERAVFGGVISDPSQAANDRRDNILRQIHTTLARSMGIEEDQLDTAETGNSQLGFIGNILSTIGIGGGGGGGSLFGIFGDALTSGFESLFTPAAPTQPYGGPNQPGLPTIYGGPNQPGIPGRAVGGAVGARRAFVVGERGPEILVTGDDSGYVFSNANSRGAAGDSSRPIVVNQNFTFSGDLDAATRARLSASSAQGARQAIQFSADQRQAGRA